MADVVVIGGAVMGSAVAYFLTADPAFQGEVVVVEPDPSYANTATARSWGGLRQQFSTPENILIGRFGVDFVRAAPDLLEVDGDKPAFSFREQGYLVLATDGGWEQLGANVELQNSLGADIELLPRAQLRDRFSWLSVDDLAGGAFGRRHEGWIDPYSLLQAFRRKARAQGAHYVHDRVVGIDVVDGKATGVRLGSGEPIAAAHVVNAAGPAAGRIAALAGIKLPVSPRKRMSYAFDCREGPRHMPLVFDISGTGMRPEGNQYMAILGPDEADDVDADPDDFEPEDARFAEVIWPIIAARVPAFEAIKLARSWAGHYDYNHFDHNAVIGPHPELGNFHFCNGFSGHGIQQSPAAGRAVAELIVNGSFQTLDLTRFGYARIANNAPLREQNVV
ncbi:MAG: FAD-binding oxidoreductase [Alphaproteobacteria bacterium]